MKPLSKEYLLLFNAVSDAEEALERLRLQMAAAQLQAEALYIAEDEDTRRPA